MSNIDLDKKVGKLLGLPYIESFQVMDKGGKVCHFDSPDKGEVERWLAGELLESPNGIGKDCTVIQDHWYLPSSGDLGNAEDVIDEMHNRGFWMRLSSPFTPSEKWFCYFEKHYHTETHPLWKASSTSPAEAVVLAALVCIEGNPEVFKTKEAAHV